MNKVKEHIDEVNRNVNDAINQLMDKHEANEFNAHFRTLTIEKPNLSILEITIIQDNLRLKLIKDYENGNIVFMSEMGEIFATLNIVEN